MKTTEEPKPFPLKRRSWEAGRNGLWWGVGGAAVAAVTSFAFPVIAISGGLSFLVGAGAYLDGAYVAHRNDDPLPVFDHGTVFLFDTVLTVLFILLFMMPAVHLDHTLRPTSYLPGLAALPGWFTYAAIGLSAFLIPVIRGLICNFGLAREADDREPMRR